MELPVRKLTDILSLRVFKENGKRPFQSFLYAQVSIYHKDSGTADYLSTELFLLPVDEGRKLAEKFDAEVLWMEMDGTIHKTSDFFEMKTP